MPKTQEIANAVVGLARVTLLHSDFPGRLCKEGNMAFPFSPSDIERGEGISAALGKHPVFPSMIIRMLTAGEQIGKIENMFERISDFLDDEIAMLGSFADEIAFYVDILRRGGAPS